MKNNKGSILVWNMLAMLIAAMFLLAAQLLITRVTNRVSIDNRGKQAYLSAKSVCDAIALPLSQYGDDSKILVNNIEPLLEAAKRAAIDKISTEDIKIDLDNSAFGDISAKIVPYDELPSSFEIVGEATVGGEHYAVGLIMTYHKSSSENVGITLGAASVKQGGLGDLVIKTGDFFFNGDLKLNKHSNLTVEDGDLHVNGSISLNGQPSIVLTNGENKIYANDIALHGNAYIQIGDRIYRNGKDVPKENSVMMGLETPSWADAVYKNEVSIDVYDPANVVGGNYYSIKDDIELNEIYNLAVSGVISSEKPLYIVVEASKKAIEIDGVLPRVTGADDEMPYVYFILKDGAKIEIDSDDGGDYCMEIFGRSDTEIIIDDDGDDSDVLRVYGKLIADTFTNNFNGTVELYLSESLEEDGEGAERFNIVKYTGK